jgi:hypothetical protein
LSDKDDDLRTFGLTRLKWLRSTYRHNTGVTWAGSSTKFPKKPGPVRAGGNLRYEISERVHGLGFGGISLFHKLARDIGLIDAIDTRLRIFKVRLP